MTNTTWLTVRNVEKVNMGLEGRPYMHPEDCGCSECKHSRQVRQNEEDRIKSTKRFMFQVSTKQERDFEELWKGSGGEE